MGLRTVWYLVHGVRRWTEYIYRDDAAGLVIEEASTERDDKSGALVALCGFERFKNTLYG